MGVRAVLAALPSLIIEKYHDDIYRAYITDALQAITGNTAMYAGGQTIQQRYYDIINKKTDNRTGDEIAADLIKRAGLEIKGGE